LHPRTALPCLLVLVGQIACHDPPARPPSLLLVTIDAIPAAALGPWSGRSPSPSPNLDALALRGAKVAQARAVAPVTLPTHTSILTGLAPARHGAWTNEQGPVSGELQTLAELLAREGYRTAAFVASDVLDDSHGLAQGFELYRDPVAVDSERIPGGPLPRLDAREVTGRALAWLGQISAAEPQAPFFAWVHYFDAHAPLDPAPPGDPRFRDGREAALFRIDEQLGRLLGSLEGRQRAQDCLVAVIGDHGVGPDYRHVPLLLAGPGIAAGAVVDQPVSQVDLMPTLLELLGRAPGAELDGASFAASLEGQRVAP